MLYVIFNTATGEVLRAPGNGVGCYKYNYKSESAAKAALTRLDKKGKLGGETVINGETFERSVLPYIKENFTVADVDTFRELHPIKMVERVNLMSGKTYMEAENTPGFMSPSSEAYWSM